MSVKLKFRASTDANKEGALYFQVIHDRIVRQIPTSYHIFASEWNEDGGKIIIPNTDSLRKDQLCLIKDKVTWLQCKIQGTITTLEKKEATIQPTILWRCISRHRMNVIQYLSL